MVDRTQDAWSNVWAWIDVRTEEAQAAFRRRLVQVCSNMLARRQCRRVDADDVVNEVFVRLARIASEKMLPDRTPGGRFAYIYGIAQNVVREGCRKGTRERSLGDDDDVSVSPAIEPTTIDLRRCLERLTTNERDLILQYTDGSPADRRALAASLGTSIGALRVKAHGIRQQLHACLGESAEKGAKD